MALFRAETRLAPERVAMAAPRRLMLRGRVATLDSAGRIIPDGFVCIEDDLIASVYLATSSRDCTSSRGYSVEGWEDYFTVVQWDQRGTGKTYAANEPKRLASSITIQEMTARFIEASSRIAV